MAAKFRPDPNSTKNEMRWRLRDPADFERFWSALYYKPLRAREYIALPDGVRAITGKLWSGRVTVQALRFNRGKWTEARARQWWQRHAHQFEKTWRVKDWK